MNQGRLWTVVKPSVGLPLFLGAVAVTSVVIHLALLTHTTWMPAYYNGKAGKTAMLRRRNSSSRRKRLPIAVRVSMTVRGSGFRVPAPFRFPCCQAAIEAGTDQVMNIVSRTLMRTWLKLGPRFLPFADAATPELPLSRLLRLSLFQVSVGMALVLLIGTLNRVMIVELGVPVSLVAVMISLPLVFAPFRAVIGYRSDIHTSALGWRRVPFIWKGTMVQFGGLAIMPFALLVLSGGGDSHNWPLWIGHAAAGLAFLLVGAGLHTIQTVGLALATDLAPAESQPKVVGLMYVMLLFGMIASALLFGALLVDFTPA